MSEINRVELAHLVALNELLLGQCAYIGVR